MEQRNCPFASAKKWHLRCWNKKTNHSSPGSLSKRPNLAPVGQNYTFTFSGYSKLKLVLEQPWRRLPSLACYKWPAKSPSKSWKDFVKETWTSRRSVTLPLCGCYEKRFLHFLICWSRYGRRRKKTFCLQMSPPLFWRSSESEAEHSPMLRDGKTQITQNMTVWETTPLPSSLISLCAPILRHTLPGKRWRQGPDSAQIIWVCPYIRFCQFYVTDICQTPESFAGVELRPFFQSWSQKS